MSHKIIEEQILDFLEDKLAGKEKVDFLDHIESCPACSKALEQHRVLNETFSRKKQAKPSSLSKKKFEAMLEREKEKNKEVKILPNSLKNVFKVAASLLLLFMGYALGEYRASNHAKNQFAQFEIQTEALKKERTLAMLENRSPSKRIQAVNYSEEMVKPDEQVLKAIIGRLHSDENVNVRLTAAEGLFRFHEHKIVKEAFLHSLKTEKSPDVQIAVIQFLVNTMGKRAKEPLKDFLREPEVPNFVKQQIPQGLAKI